MAFLKLNMMGKTHGLLVEYNQIIHTQAALQAFPTSAPFGLSAGNVCYWKWGLLLAK